MTTAPVISDLERLRAEIATLRQILEVHEKSSYEQAIMSEQALARTQREEARYRSLVAATTAVVWSIDETGQFVVPQPSWEAYTGQPWEEHRGFGWTNAIHSEDRENVRADWERARSSRKLYQSEGRLFHAPSNEFRFFLGRAVPIFERDGSVSEWIGTVVDVDEQHRAEEALRISDERFRVVSRATNDAVWDWNLATDELWWNDAVRTLFGFEPHQVDPKITWWYEHCHVDDRERVVSGIHAVIDRGGHNWSDEYRFAHSDGRYLDVLDRGFVIRDGNGGPLRMVGAMQDITERKRRTRQLRQLSEISATINSNLAPEEILQQVTDAAPELIRSRQAFSVLRRDLEQEETLRCLSRSNQSDACDLEIETAASGLLEFVCESNAALRLTRSELAKHPGWRTSDPESSPNGWLAAPIIGRDGGTCGSINLIGRDDSDFTAEDEGILVQLAQVTFSAIENARLYEQARAANRTKDDFFAAVSHELRTPMTSIIGWTRLLSPDVDQETLGEAVTAIGTSAATQAQLIDDLLDISRIAAGKLLVDREPLDLGSVATDVVTAMKPAAAAKGISLVVPSRREYLVIGDRVRLRQVIGNLLSNALKFTPRGGIITTSLELENSEVVLRVSDTGEGIPREFLPHVFDRHAQRVSGRQGGLGLGLAIVLHIIERHGGTTSAESEGEGKGATFTIRIPALVASR